MPDSPHERRRYPRLAPEQPAQLHVPVVHDVEIVDISQSGMLFRCARRLRVGQRTHVYAVLNGQPFSALMEIVRVDAEQPATGRRQRAAASFIAIDDSSRRTLQRLLVPQH